MSDLVTLCVGLPFEVVMNWNQYPWPFPDFVCNLKGLVAETTSSVSILTILLFCIERYIAVNHPFVFVKLKPIRRQVSGRGGIIYPQNNNCKKRETIRCFEGVSHFGRHMARVDCLCSAVWILSSRWLHSEELAWHWGWTACMRCFA